MLSAGYYDAYYLRAQKVRALIARDFTEAFKTCDVLLTPATPGPAFAHRREDLRSRHHVPLRRVHGDGESRGLAGPRRPGGIERSGPAAGLQLIGKAFDEATLLRAGRAIETAANFTAKPQPWWRAA